MKKLFALLLVAVMCFSLVACGGGNDTTTANNNNEQQTNNGETQQTNENDTSSKEDKTENAVNLVGKWTGTYKDGTAYTLILNEDGTGTLESEYGKNELQWQADTCLLYSEKEDLCLNTSEDHKEFELIVDGDILQLKMGDAYQFTKEK